MTDLTAKHLHQLFPGLSLAKCADYAPHLNAAVRWGNINTRARLAAFVAQLGHESVDLAHLKEIWGNTPAQNRYDTRVDLGNTPERDGDGRKYMGRGGLQRTGKTNYRRFQEATGLPVIDHPELLERPEFAFESDVLYWTDNRLNRLADKLTLRADAADLAQFDKITRAINGGYNGRVDRQRRYLAALATLPAALFDQTGTNKPTTDTEASTDGTKASTDGTKAPEAEPADDAILLEKLAGNDSAKAAGVTILKRLGRPVAVLFGALEAGNVYVWLGLGVLVVGAGVLIYLEREPLANLFRKLIRR